MTKLAGMNRSHSIVDIEVMLGHKCVLKRLFKIVTFFGIGLKLDFFAKISIISSLIFIMPPKKGKI